LTKCYTINKKNGAGNLIIINMWQKGAKKTKSRKAEESQGEMRSKGQEIFELPSGESN